MPDFKKIVEDVNSEFLQFKELETLQVNLGNRCNQRCAHCHLKASPEGSNIMSRNVMEKIIHFLKNQRRLILDITGGSPELNPNFKFFLESAHVSRLMVRTNLTALLEEGMEWIPEWYKNHKVVVIASLPCYTEENVNKQRGNGVFKKSIGVLKRLNELEYGGSLELNLVYNPGGDFLPGAQQELEKAYKEQLYENYGITFTNLFTITNAPLGRFKNYLIANGKLEQYMKLLTDNFNPQAAANIMCRTLISVDYRGHLYNCDFNQVLELPIRNRDGRIMTIDDIEAIRKGDEIVMAEHCYCCTAGAGSSCTGALAQQVN